MNKHAIQVFHIKLILRHKILLMNHLTQKPIPSPRNMNAKIAYMHNLSYQAA